MQVEDSRRHAADLLLGRAEPDLRAFEGVPPYLRARAARRAAVGLLTEAESLSDLERGALVRAAIADADVMVRERATRVLAQKLPPGLATPVLIACTSDEDERVRKAAEEALAHLPSEASVVPLRASVVVEKPASTVPRFIAH